MIATNTGLRDTGYFRRSRLDDAYECEQLAYDGEWDLYDREVSKLSDKDLNRLISLLQEP